MVQEYIRKAILAHKLPASFSENVINWYTPIAEDIAQQISERRESGTEDGYIVGVQGTQGSGKSTMAAFLSLLLKHEHALKVAIVSIDDFYHTRQTRLALAKSEHPLLVTRGVPGTHDIPLAMHTLNNLKFAQTSDEYSIPRFDKAEDDRAAEDSWPRTKGSVDVIIFEGWCVGAQPQPTHTLLQPCNTLEAQEDADKAWRTYVNTQLATDYAKLFEQLDCLAVMTAPSFDVVHKWRSLQEKKLADKIAMSKNATTAHLLNEQGITRFISHYQRITEHCLATLPAKADWVLALDEQHKITSLKRK